jgi:ParB family transcriptional regulator, chromosome partitioning protein
MSPKKPDLSMFRKAVGETAAPDMFGLSANFPKVIEIELSRIVANPDQPRKTFDPVSLQELAQSIDQHGLLQPITVKPHEKDLFMLVAGERRYRAHELLNKPTIFAIVTDGNVQELALIENVQREDLHPVELARALSDLMHSRNYTQEDLGRVIGKARNTVASLLSLNNLHEEIRMECPTSDISKSVLIEIARLPKRDDQLRMWKEVKSGSLKTVRAAREKKEAGDVRTPQTPSTRLLAVGRSFAKQLNQLAPDQGAFNRDQIRELRDLSTQIVSLIDGLAEPQ